MQGLLQATPSEPDSEGRRSDTQSSPQLPQDPTDTTDGYGLDGAVGKWASPSLPQGQQDSSADYCGPDGAAGGRGQSNTAVSGLHDHATSRERADTSV